MKRLCAECGQRPAKYIRRNYKKGRQLIVSADSSHSLCTRCHNSQFEREKQRRLAEKYEYA